MTSSSQRKYAKALGLMACDWVDVLCLEPLADNGRERPEWLVLDRLDDNSSTCLLRYRADQGKQPLFATAAK